MIKSYIIKNNINKMKSTEHEINSDFKRKELSKQEQLRNDFNLQITPFIKIATVVCIVLCVQHLWRQGFLSMTLNTSYLTSKFFWFFLFSLTTSHIIYFLIWQFPEAYIRFFSWTKVHPVDLTFRVVVVGRTFQFSTSILWYLYTNNFFLDGKFDIPFNLIQVVSSVFLIICGQWLVFAVWDTIGIDGVCYGFKLGRFVPWVDTFPFNIGVAHPQYVGSVITEFGAVSLLINSTTTKAGILIGFLMTTLAFSFSAFVESIPQSKGKKK